MKRTTLVIILLAVLVVSCLALTACTPKYTVTWQNWDGTVLEVDTEVEEGTIPTYDGATPTKAADAQYTYEFVGWDKAIVAVTGETTYTAKFDAKLNSYTVTWLNWDGSVLKTDAVEYGQTPTYTGATPTKEGNAQYSYTFTGWTPSIDNVTGNATYTAQFSTSINAYTVTWRNWDGTILEVDENIEYGTMPIYDGTTPTRERDAQYTYTFIGWDQTVDTVTANASYVAQYSRVTNKYTVTWCNWDGTVLEVDENMEYATWPNYDGQIPVKVGDAQYTYEFVGWTPRVNSVTGNATYVAQFSNSVNTYKVTWCNWDGRILEIDVVEYGTMPTYDGEVPTKQADAQYTYTFENWEPTVDTVVGNVTYVAQYSHVTNTYTVTWSNWDGSVLKTDTVEYGQTPTYDGATPTKQADAQYTYTFASWSPSVDTVIGDVTYTAQYSQVTNTYTVTWCNWDGRILEIDVVEYGTMPTYDGETPTRQADAQYTYAFENWEPTVDTVVGNVTYVAQYSHVTNTYTVTWCNWDGSVLEVDENIEYGTMPTYDGETPLKEKDVQYTYVFNNWDKEVTHLTGDVTYTAQFNQYTNYSITYNLDGGNDNAANPTYYTVLSKTITLIQPEKTGYTFIGWTSSEQTSPVLEVTIPQGTTGDKEYTANWKANIYQITLDGNGIEMNPATIDVAYDSEFNLPQPSREGYKFIGWYENGNLFEEVTWERIDNLELIAKWEANSYRIIYQDTYRAYVNVTYNYNYTSSSNTTVSLQNGEILSYPTVPTREGYAFAGWYTDKNCTSKFEFNVNITEDLVLYAKWVSMTSAISVEYIDIANHTDESTKKSIKVTRSTYSPQYYYFTCYATGTYTFNLSRNSEGLFYVSVYNLTQSTYIQKLYQLSDTKPNLSVTFSARAGDVVQMYFYKSDTINNTDGDASFYVSGADYPISIAKADFLTFSSGSRSTSTVNFDSYCNLLEPQRTGYTFLGWYNGEDKFESGTWNYTSNIILTPRWQANTYTITLDANGGELGDESITATYDQEYTLPTPTRTGYTFGGWFSGTTEYTGGTWQTTSDTILVAKWIANKYTLIYDDIDSFINITFNYNYSGSTSTTVTLRHGRTLGRPLDPTRSDYVFTGWYTDSSCTTRYEFTGTITGDMTLYAGWTEMSMTSLDLEVQIDPSVYNDTWDCYSVSTSGTSSIAKKHIYLVAQESGTHCIYNRGSEYYSCHLQVYNLTAKKFIQEDTIIYSQTWNSITFTCSRGDVIVISLYGDSHYLSTLAFFYFSGFGSPAISTATANCLLSEAIYDTGYSCKDVVTYDENYTLPTPIRPHYTFLGWYNGEEKFESGAWNIASDVVLVAKWERVEHIINYNLDGGTNALDNPAYYAVNDEITLIAPTKTGYTFLGWTGSNGDVPELNVTFNGEDFFEREYTAHWEVAVFTVDYILNGGTNPSKNPTAITMYDEFELKEATKTGYAFDGWYLDDEFTLPISTLTNITSDVTLFAKFVPNKYTATFDSNGAERSDKLTITLHAGVNSTTKTVTINNGDSFAPYDYWQPKVSGYVFVGWMYNSDLIGNKLEITGDIDLYAKWVANPNGYPVLGEDDTAIYSHYQTEYFFISYNYTRIRYEIGASHSYLDVKSPTTGLVTHTYYASGFASISANGLDISTERWPYASRTKEEWDKSGYATLEPGTLVKISAGLEGDTNVYVYGYANVEIAGKTTHNNKITVSDKRIKSQEYDAKIIAPSVSKAGYYVEWYDQDGNLMTDTWQYTQDQTFTAKWQLIDYTIKYVLDGGENSPYNPGHYNVTQSITLEDAEKEGYTFGGWYSDSKFTQKVTSINYTTGNRTLYAKFTPNSYTANLDFDGGTSSPTVTFISDGEIVDSLWLAGDDNLSSYYPPAKEGYMFGGWYLDENCQNVFNFSQVITEDLTLYAKWISSDVMCHNITSSEVETESIVINGTSEIKITFVPLASGNITISTTSQLDVKGILYNQNMVKVAEADDISDEDYNFSITYNVEAGKQYTIAIKGATTLTKGDCEVLFSFDGSMGVSGTTYTSVSFDVVYDDQFQLPTPTKEGHEFLGWFDANGNEVTSTTWNYAADTTLYAYWVVVE